MIYMQRNKASEHSDEDDDGERESERMTLRDGFPGEGSEKTTEEWPELETGSRELDDDEISFRYKFVMVVG